MIYQNGFNGGQQSVLSEIQRQLQTSNELLINFPDGSITLIPKQ
jgi:hypothetical protein